MRFFRLLPRHAAAFVCSLITLPRRRRYAAAAIFCRMIITICRHELLLCCCLVAVRCAVISRRQAMLRFERFDMSAISLISFYVLEALFQFI